jgi:hypothetical protein
MMNDEFRPGGEIAVHRPAFRPLDGPLRSGPFIIHHSSFINPHSPAARL